MKKLKFSLILLLLPGAMIAQDTTIVNLVNKWWTGWAEKDTMVFVEMADERFLEFTGNHSARSEGKKKLLQTAKVVLPILEITELEITKTHVVYHGNTAICHYYFAETGSFNGKEFNDVGCATDVFVQKQGKWKLVSHHGTKFNQLINSK